MVGDGSAAFCGGQALCITQSESDRSDRAGDVCLGHAAGHSAQWCPDSAGPEWPAPCSPVDPVVYPLDATALKNASGPVSQRASELKPRSRVAPAIWLLGLVSCFTDISSEMVASVLPLYLFVHLQLSPLEFGVLDGLYQGVTAVARLAAGVVADRWQWHKFTAVAGYGLSALCKLGLLAVGPAFGGIAAVLSIDRIGKGIRTAPRDALIALHATRADLAASFGVHRALDAAGVVIGPLLAFAVLRSAPGRFDAVFVTSFSAALSSVAIMSDAFLYLILTSRAGHAVERLPLLYVGTALVFLALAVPLGRWADRRGRARVFVGGHLLMVTVYGGTFLVTNTPALIACLVLHGVSVEQRPAIGYRAYVLEDLDHQPEVIRALDLPGLPSRARVSRDSRLAAYTVFVSGDSYVSAGFSTRTRLLDLTSGHEIGDLEGRMVTRDGERFQAVDFNFWGVTFAPDATRFFATLGSGGRVFLVAGEPASHALTVVAEGIECPSLSPDGTRIAFKHTRDGSAPRHWQPAILELSTNRMTVLPETRSVDDQLEWLDNDHVVYALRGPQRIQPRRADIWQLPADGHGGPTILFPDAESPAVVRN